MIGCGVREWYVCNALVNAVLLCPETRRRENFASGCPRGYLSSGQSIRHHFWVANHLPLAHANRPQIRLRMVQQAILASQEARDCAVSAGADHMLPLILMFESRTSLDLRALTNMRGGRLKSHHEESGEYADELKALDTALTGADPTRALLMPHGASTYTSALLDLLQDACDLYAAQSAPGGGSGGGGSMGGITTSAADIAAAVSAVSEANKLESSKECTITYEQGKHATHHRRPLQDRSWGGGACQSQWAIQGQQIHGANIIASVP